ncbi:hypothetical protein RZV17_18730 [Xanthomonas cannabis]|uniref:hypothetical protein n=1 Tax=Xanthomonas cannabis TaxID=1885674 RepID=UPI0033BB8715
MRIAIVQRSIAILSLSVFRHTCVGTLANVVVEPARRQEISDAQSLARQGFDIKLSAR